MYRGFNIKNYESSQLENYFNIGKANQELEMMQITDAFKKYFVNNQFYDGEQIMNDWFPLQKTDVFLSHSHKDLNLALCLAGELIDRHKLKVFVDSTVWLKSADLLKIIDNKFCKNLDEATYSYEKRNFSTSHVHLMLSNSLNRMIDNTEALFFLNTPNSLYAGSAINHQTFSPWIYSELQTSKLIRKKTPKRLLMKTKVFSNTLQKSVQLNESLSEELNIAYQADLDHLSTLDKHQFDTWINNLSYNSEDALNKLYKLFPAKNIQLL